MFRAATISDTPFMLELGREIYHKTAHVHGIEFDDDTSVETIMRVIRAGVCLVGPSSMAGAMIREFPYNRRARIASVVFWNFRRPREITILEALMNECRSMGATHFSAASHAPDYRIGRWYDKKGLRPCDLSSITAL